MARDRKAYFNAHRSRKLRAAFVKRQRAKLALLRLPGGLRAVVVPVSTSVLYVIEDRQRIGEDRELCDKGVLVWIVDGSRGNVDHNAVVQAAGRSYNDACGAIYDAGYDIGPGEVSTFEDANAKLELLDAFPKRVVPRAHHAQMKRAG